MAEVCCERVSGAGAEALTTDACESISRTARRRRMRMHLSRPLRFDSGLEAILPAEELAQKKRKLDGPSFCTEKADVDLCSGGGTEDLAEESSGVSDWRPRYGMASVCGRRRDMEDAVSAHQDFVRRGVRDLGRCHFFGVYDGHGCSHVAASCEHRMHEIVAEELEKLEQDHLAPPSPNWGAVMEKSFSRMDAEASAAAGSRAPGAATCRCEMQTPNCDHVGSTSVVAVVTAGEIVVANCGDSRAVLYRRGAAVPLSSDQKPDRPDELERIESAGGRVIYWDSARVLGVLAMSRAIGDGYLKPFVISEPEVTIKERSEDDECLILASDGLWDVVTNEMAGNVVRSCLRGNGRPPKLVGENGGGNDGDRARCGRGSDKACKDAAKLLTRLALSRRSMDNVSVVVVDLRRTS